MGFPDQQKSWPVPLRVARFEDIWGGGGSLKKRKKKPLVDEKNFMNHTPDDY